MAVGCNKPTARRFSADEVVRNRRVGSRARSSDHVQAESEACVDGGAQNPRRGDRRSSASCFIPPVRSAGPSDHHFGGGGDPDGTTASLGNEAPRQGPSKGMMDAADLLGGMQGGRSEDLEDPTGDGGRSWRKC